MPVMSIYDYDLEGIEQMTPFENFISGIKDAATSRKYKGQLEMFLNPQYWWDLSQQKRKLMPEDDLAALANDFVNMMKKDPDKGKTRIKKYAAYVKKMTEDGVLNPNTAKNRLKPIKALLNSNEIEFSWHLINKIMPKPVLERIWDKCHNFLPHVTVM